MAVVFFSRPRLLPLLVLLVCAPEFFFALAITALGQPQGQNTTQGSEASKSFDQLAAHGNSAREQGKSEDAVRDYDAALKLRPDWPEGWWYLGSLQADLGRYSDAISAFDKLVGLKADFGPGWASRGLCHFEIKNYDKAFADLKRGQELGLTEFPAEEKAATYHLALLMNRRGEFEDAWDVIASKFGNGILPEQAKRALALALLRVPLLPDDVDPSKDGLLDGAGETAALLVQGNFDQALSSFRQILKNYPDTPFLHYAYGSALMFRSQFDEAKTELREETRITPGSALPYMRLAIVAMKTHQPQKALPDARRATELAPNSAMAHEILARILTELGKGNDAASEAALAARLKPEKPQPDPHLAALYAQTSSAPRDSKRPEPWVELAFAEFERKDYKNAFLHLERGRELGYQGNAQQMTVAVTRLAELRNLNGDFFGASELLIPEARRGRLTEEMKLTLGMSMLHVPLLPQQISASAQPLLRDAGDTAALLYSSRYDDTFRAFEKMLQRYPGTPFLHYAYASALETLSRYEDAEAQLREEIKITPQSPLSYMRLAAIELKQRRPEQALEYAKHAVQLDPQAAGAHELMGRALLENGNIEEAVKQLETASKLAPNYPEVHFNLARAYTKAKMKAQADHERALFAQLNAAAEREKSTEAQAYGVPQSAPDDALRSAAPVIQKTK